MSPASHGRCQGTDESLRRNTSLCKCDFCEQRSTFFEETPGRARRPGAVVAGLACAFEVGLFQLVNDSIQSDAPGRIARDALQHAPFARLPLRGFPFALLPSHLPLCRHTALLVEEADDELVIPGVEPRQRFVEHSRISTCCTLRQWMFPSGNVVHSTVS